MVKRLLPLLLGLCVPLLLAGPALAEPIGIKSLEVTAENEPTAEQKADHEPGSNYIGVPGAPDVQAGSHPYALVTTFRLNGPEAVEEPETYLLSTGGGLKDASFELPPGFVGNPNATPRCNFPLFVARRCPNDTAVGEATTSVRNGEPGASKPEAVVSNPVYNLETPGGVAADFGYLVDNVVPIYLNASVRSGSDYGITVNVPNIPLIRQVIASKVTIWGVPGAAVHDPLRGKCLAPDETPGGVPHNEEQAECGASTEPGIEPVVPLLTNPTSCGVSRTARLSVESWGEPAEPPAKPAAEPPSKAEETVTLPPLSGCEKLDFSPTLSVQPDGTAGSTPTGLNVALHVSQESTTNPEGFGESDVKDTTVALPPGVQISPSAADGLQACSNAQVGFKGVNPVTGADEFTPYLPGSVAAKQAVAAGTAPESEGTLEPGENFCPDASKIATVRIATPLLEHELTGAVYLAAPQNFQGLPENPFSSLIAMYLVAEEPNTGVLVKLPGRVSLNEATGQITTTFENTPQLPFSELKLEFFGTARAPLATPALCGTYNTEASLQPWSAPPGGTSSSAAHPPASFQITSGPNGSSCTYPGQALPFSPSLTSDTTNVQAGAFSPLETTLTREDGQQSIQAVTLHYPAGLSGMLAGVKLCGEAEANAGTCGPESEIGETIVSVGLGNDPFTVTGGRVYITGPYNGTSTCTVGTPECAPFGLSIVNPAKAGPFDLQEGRPVVVRAKINVDPHTAALTITTNSSGPYAIPHIIDGIPLQIKHVNVNVDRPGFTFNPTSCAPTQVTGTVTSAEGASSPVAIPFAVGACQSLKFTPKFSAATSGKTSKAHGASLTLKVARETGPASQQANFAEAKIELPKQLPSRLTTLQKACTAAQFEANPAGCPAASDIGHVKVVTPELPVPLEGPAYFVSHGGEAFPSVIAVLQGDGVTIQVVSTTFISKSGITSATIKAAPDAPFSSFELTFPEKQYSALAANGNLCKSKLAMPTEFTAQNGLVIHQSTPIGATGCAPAIDVTKHSVKGNTATIAVSVPAAGKLVATGKGLSKASKTAKGATTVTLKLTLTKGEVATLKKHKGGKLKAKIELRFTPKTGSKLATSTTVAIG